MSQNTKIPWAHHTWNIAGGCRKTSTGCEKCYALTFAHKLSQHDNPKISERWQGLTQVTRNGELRWTGKQVFFNNRLHDPQEWKAPARVFVGAMTDIFYDLTFDQIDDIFYNMRPGYASRHKYLLLTKYPERMLEWADSTNARHYDIVGASSNVWWGVSVENQAAADKRIPLLLQMNSFLDNAPLNLWINAEPLLQSLDLSAYLQDQIKFVVAGAESGDNARIMKDDWVRSIRNQCQSACVPFYFKQKCYNGKKIYDPVLDGMQHQEFPVDLLVPSDTPDMDNQLNLF